MAEPKNIIKSIKLDLGKKEITLTVKQAKALKDALDGLFGHQYIREIIRDNPIWPVYPWVWQEPLPVTYPPYYYFCEDADTTTAFDVSTQTMSMSIGGANG